MGLEAQIEVVAKFREPPSIGELGLDRRGGFRISVLLLMVEKSCRTQSDVGFVHQQ